MPISDVDTSSSEPAAPVSPKCAGDPKTSRMLTFVLGSWDWILIFRQQAVWWILVRIHGSNYVNRRGWGRAIIGLCGRGGPLYMPLISINYFDLLPQCVCFISVVKR
jgi:hypothetical protein